MSVYHTGYGNAWASVTRAVRMLLIANGAVYLAQILLDLILNQWFTTWFGLSRYGLEHGAVWQLGSYMFLHGPPFHLLFNMLMLFFFGPETERMLGTARFWRLYLLSGVVGGVGWVLLSRGGLCTGASGSIFGVLAAFAAMNPHRRMRLLIFPFRSFPAWGLVGAIIFIEVIFMIGGPDGNVAHAAHVFGAVAGYFYVRGFRGLRFPSRLVFRRGRRPGLRVVSDSEPPPRPRAADVDRILDKVAREGLHSLTSSERAVLEAAGDGSRRR